MRPRTSPPRRACGSRPSRPAPKAYSAPPPSSSGPRCSGATIAWTTLFYWHRDASREGLGARPAKTAGVSVWRISGSDWLAPLLEDTHMFGQKSLVAALGTLAFAGLLAPQTANG